MTTTYENYSDKWFTPPAWLDWVSCGIGAGFFDPCPESPVLDGLTMPWPARPRYINHPGGKRGVGQAWWARAQERPDLPLVWCAFSVEQLRTLNPSPLTLPGYLYLPKKRLRFIWGGPAGFTNSKGKLVKRTPGEPARSPSNWAVFWSNVVMGPTPEPCFEVRTGE